MSAATSITVRVPLKIRRRPGRKTVVTPVAEEGGDAAIQTRADPALVKALARAFRYQRLLDDGCYASITEMAAGERIERGYLGCLMRLTLLAPPIVDAILNGRQPEDTTLPRLQTPFPELWAEQCVLFGRKARLQPDHINEAHRLQCTNVTELTFMPNHSGRV